MRKFGVICPFVWDFLAHTCLKSAFDPTDCLRDNFEFRCIRNPSGPVEELDE